jgi:hypothetical protein
MFFLINNNNNNNIRGGYVKRIKIKKRDKIKGGGWGGWVVGLKKPLESSK